LSHRLPEIKRLAKPQNILLSDIERRKRNRKLVRASLFLVAAIGIAGLMGFVSHQHANAKCWEVEVKIIYADSSVFLTKDDILKSIHSHLDSVQNFPLNEIDLNTLHRLVTKANAVKQAGVYTTIDGRCVIEVEQRVPVMRVFNDSGESFYLDNDGFSFPANYRAAVRLPVVTGHIPDGVQSESYLSGHWANKSVLDDALRLAQFITTNEFWNAQIEQLYLNAQGDFEAITRVGDHQVIIGDASDLERKFKKWMAFYAHTIQAKNLNEYKTINLKFENQVVCAK
jgi:cell division protein FtsQ